MPAQLGRIERLEERRAEILERLLVPERGYFYAIWDAGVNDDVLPVAQTYCNGGIGAGVTGYFDDAQKLIGGPEIPEPATLLLLGLGLSACGLVASRKRRG